jgi:hypothetical protein
MDFELNSSNQKEKSQMRAKSLKSVVAFLVLLAFIVPAFAKEINRTISLPDQTKIAGKTLKRGDYTFKVSDTKLTIEMNNKVMAEATGRWEPRDKKVATDGFSTGADGQVQEVHFAGEKRVFVVTGQ